MNAMLKKFVDQEFMTEQHAMHIENAISNQDTIIVSGHKGWGILPLMAGISATAKAQYSIKQVKKFEDLQDEAQYYVIADLKDIDFEKLIFDTIAIPNSSSISIKDPDHPYSLFKLLKDVYAKTNDTSKTIQLIECAKTDDKKHLSKITKIYYDANRKMIKEKL